MTLAPELGMRPHVAHCHLGLGRTYQQVGKRQKKSFRGDHDSRGNVEMDMPWLEKLKAVSHSLSPAKRERRKKQKI
jgi:hypothetical protein